MVFALASHLRESLTAYLQSQVQEKIDRASRQREAELQAEEEKFQGTAVTKERFLAWRVEFLRKQAELREKAEAAYMAGLSNKEREEYKRLKSKPSGRELFSRDAALDDEKVTDDSVKDVDWSLYDRETREESAREALESDREEADLLAGGSDDE